MDLWVLPQQADDDGVFLFGKFKLRKFHHPMCFILWENSWKCCHFCRCRDDDEGSSCNTLQEFFFESLKIDNKDNILLESREMKMKFHFFHTHGEIFSSFKFFFQNILMSNRISFASDVKQWAKKMKKVPFFSISKMGQKSIFELGKSLKLPKMQFHEKKILI